MTGHVAPEDPVAMAIGGMGDMSGMSDAGKPQGMQHGGGMSDGQMAMPKTSPGRKGQGEQAKTRKPPKASPMPGMDHGSMPGMNSQNQMPMPKEKRAMDQGAMPGMSPKSSSDRSQPATTSTGGVQQGPQAYLLHDGEDMPNVGPSMQQTMPDPISNDTGAPPGTRVLSYRDLRPLKPYPYKHYDRIIEIRLTGNMQRYFWSINGRKFSEAEPIVLRLGERARFRFINETMMNHPMHIHGTWMLPDVGNGGRNPKKHTVNIKPGTTLDVDIPADAEGPWAFHCHLLYHMETGMMRQVNVVRQTASLK
jgi:FtsP/CotA-like multicopper oxidase with cupredoxin domain